jgi:hypothetical protein
MSATRSTLQTLLARQFLEEIQWRVLWILIKINAYSLSFFSRFRRRLQRDRPKEICTRTECVLGAGECPCTRSLAPAIHFSSTNSCNDSSKSCDLKLIKIF